MDDYYVYCYFTGETPIYIGAGRGKRDVSHLHLSARGHRYFYWRLCRMQQAGYKLNVRRLLEGLTFRASRDWERFFIQAVGREDLKLGPLLNLTDGGEGTANRVVSDITRQRLSVAMKVALARPGVKQRIFGAIKAALARPEVKQRISMVRKAAWNRPEVRQKRVETDARPEVKQRRSEALKVALARPGVKQRQSEAMKVTRARPEVKQRMSEALKAAHARPEVKERVQTIARHRQPKGRFKGVYPSGRKWRAEIDHKYLGTFPTQIDAARAYNDAVDKYWGGDGWKNRVQSILVAEERRCVAV